MPTRENRLLAALSSEDQDRLIPRMTVLHLAHRDVVYRVGGPLDYVYFPRTGIVSEVVVMESGSTAEVAAVGFEGMLGSSTFLGEQRSSHEVFCQVPPADCLRWPTAEFLAEIARHERLYDIVRGYLNGVLRASARSTACNSLHTVDERCARWLLMSQDRCGTEEFALTQEFLAMMLGCRRATVTVSAGHLQSEGLITYRHGRVKVINREGLEKAACECYPIIRDAFLAPI